MKVLAILMILFTISSIPAFSIQDDPQNRATASESELQNAQGEEINQVLVDEQLSFSPAHHSRSPIPSI